MNVLVIDDQRDVVQGIVQGVRWQLFPIHQVFSAYNAYEAKALIQTQPIDIVLCDIEMPKENGLVLFKWIKAYNNQIEGIFLTSHEEFHYAREAIKLGSFDYIIQPAPYTEIEEVLERVVHKI